MKKMNLKKNNIYRLQVHGNINEILESLTILRPQGLSPVPSYTMVRSEKNARAFLQGIFLACGSINSPKTANYHMELSLPQKQQAELCSKLLSRFYIPSKIVKRKQYYVLYTKAGDKIADFLRLCNVSRCLFEFEDARITRDYYNQLTRLDNCEVANEMKTIKAAAEQLAWIETIEKKGGVKISDKLQRVIDARKAHPEASTMELCKVIEEQYGETISKSGMKHRLGKLKETAARLEEADAR
jgi:DNA-binding protein WhiA